MPPVPGSDLHNALNTIKLPAFRACDPQSRRDGKIIGKMTLLLPKPQRGDKLYFPNSMHNNHKLNIPNSLKKRCSIFKP